MIKIDYRTVRKRIPVKYKFNRTVLRQLRNPIKVAQETAKHVRKRVAIRGKTATAPRSYAPKNRETAYFVGPDYMRSLGISNHDGRFESSREFHSKARTKARTFKVTGGMWEGLTASNEGTTKARFMFERSSLGKASKKRKLKKDSRIAKETGRRYAIKSRKAKNSAKAWAVFKNLKVHPLQTTPNENAAMGAAVLSAAHSKFEKFFGSGHQEVVGMAQFDRKLYRNILRRLKKK